MVQPNFDVVFLAPSPATEVVISRFAERKGRRVGVLFQITKQSIFIAASAGLAAKQAIESLRRVCANELPANVERESAVGSRSAATSTCDRPSSYTALMRTRPCACGRSARAR